MKQQDLTLEKLRTYFERLTTCPLCACTNHRKLFTVNKLSFFECIECHFRFMNPHLSNEGMSLLYENSHILEEANPALADYYEYEVSDKSCQTAIDYRNILMFAKKNVKAGLEKPRLFEIGTGRGAFLLTAVETGWDVCGVDTSRENVRFLNETFNLDVACRDFHDFEPSTNKFHMVVFWDVIEHTIRPQLFVKKAYQMLQSGGLLVMATPNISGLLNIMSEALHTLSLKTIHYAIERLYVLEHVGYYTPHTLKRLAQDQGFAIKKEFFSDTDLERYKFSPILRLALQTLFFLSRLIKRQNRFILVAEKLQHE